jgi:hypothetical protein
MSRIKDLQEVEADFDLEDNSAGLFYYLHYLGIFKIKKNFKNWRLLNAFMLFFIIGLPLVATFKEFWIATELTLHARIGPHLLRFLSRIIVVGNFLKCNKKWIQFLQKSKQLKKYDENSMVENATKKSVKYGIALCVITIILMSEMHLRYRRFQRKLPHENFIKTDSPLIERFAFLLQFFQGLLSNTIFFLIECIHFSCLFILAAHFRCAAHKLRSLKKPENTNEMKEHEKNLKDIIIYHKEILEYVFMNILTKELT